jgi:YbbR domain-containing protein
VQNLGFKIIAFVVALVLWFGVKTERQAEVAYPVPLEVLPRSDDETIISPLPRTVDVIFSGTGKELLRLGDQNYRVRKFIDPGPPGPRRVIMDITDVTGSANLSVKPVGVRPSVLTLTVDQVVSKRVPLKPLGRFEDDEEAEEVRFDPSSVTLIGARSILANIDTVAVDLSHFLGRGRELRQAIAVRIPDYPTVIVQPDSIRVLARAEEQAAEPGDEPLSRKGS